MNVGIYFGNHYFAMAIVRENGERSIIKNIDGDNTTPSVVHWKKNSEIIVGRRAKNLSIAFPDTTIMDIKRKIGSSEKVKIYDKEYTPEEISSFILAKLKKDAEEQLGEKITNVVVSVPAYFRDGERKATRIAAKMAGWKDEEIVIVNEPNAVAMEFGLEKKLKKGKILVFDIGGGTLDLTIINIENGILNVVTNGGERWLGGKDFDKRIVDYIIDEIKNEHEINLNEEKYIPEKQDIVIQAEMAKNALSSNISSEIFLRLVTTDKNVNYSKEITRDKFNELIKDLVEKTKDITIKTLKDKDIDKKELDKIVMVGGCSRIPAIRDALKEIFPGKEFLLHDPDLAIAKGAAIYARIYSTPKTPEEERIRDDIIDNSGPGLVVAIHSVGTDAIVNNEEGIFSILIKKDTPLPAKNTKTYYTVSDNQTNMLVEIYEGEKSKAKENFYWPNSDLLVTDIPPKPKGVEGIDLTYELSKESRLSVTVKILSTGKEFKKELDYTKESLADMDHRIKKDIEYLK